MGKAGGIIAIVAGVFGVIAAAVTLFVGGLGSAFQAEGAKTIVGLGWGGVLFSFLAIVFGAIALAKPKGAGIALIIVSIAGAILGGTLVAICMALSLLGGILAVFGAKKAGPSTSSEVAEASGRKSNVWLWVGGSVLALVVVVVVVGSLAPSQPNADPIAELAAAQASRLKAEGELSELFAMGSKNTDLQRENKLKEIQGQVVEWTLPVYEVSKAGEGYKIQTKSRVRIGSFGTELVGTFVTVTPRSDEERRQIEALKTDDIVSFKGRIAGSTLRSLDIKPAILAARTAPVPAAAVTLPPQQSAIASTVEPNVSKPAASPEPSTVAAPAVQASWKPSFDCTKASSISEKAVCSDSILGKLDGALSENYKRMLASDIGDGARNDLRATQKTWLAERNKCGDNACLVAIYRKRVDEVCEYPVISGVHPMCASSDEIK